MDRHPKDGPPEAPVSGSKHGTIGMLYSVQVTSRLSQNRHRACVVDLGKHVERAVARTGECLEEGQADCEGRSLYRGSRHTGYKRGLGVGHEHFIPCSICADAHRYLRRAWVRLGS